MIGNLFSAISIALLSSIFAIGGVKADTVDNKAATLGVSWITGEQCTVYSTGSFNLSSTDDSEYTHNTAMKLDGTVLNTGVWNGLSPLLAQRYAPFIDYWYTGEDVFNIQASDKYALNFANYPYTSTYYDINQPNNVSFTQSYFTFFRFYFPLNSKVSGIEFYLSNTVNINAVGISYYDRQNFIFMDKFTSANNRFYGLYNFGNVFEVNNGELSPQSPYYFNNDDVNPFRFAEYVVSIGFDEEFDDAVKSCTINYQLVNSLGVPTYSMGYSTGYNTGFREGDAVGYARGYANGLNLSQNGNFMSLFSSIADTPLRFIYGLFNFDLFGTSVLVIVLTLLTGIIVFGIVKKFWK